MQEQLAVQHLLQSRYQELREKNASYSIRAYSRKVGLNSGALSAIMNGKRNVSAELARRVCERLALDPQERMEILALFPQKRAYRKLEDAAAGAPQDVSYLQLSAAQYRVIGEWQHFAIITLMRTQGFKSDPAWIANRLGLTISKVEQAIARLISVGIVEREADGSLKKVQQKFRTTDDVVDMSVRKSHEENLDLAKESLHRDSIDERDFTHINLAIDPKNMSMAKELVRKFQDDFAKLVETGNQSEVYRLSMQLFPLSKLEEVKK